jgi:hypothetical protein
MRAVRWLRPDLQRDQFRQDLLQLRRSHDRLRD